MSPTEQHPGGAAPRMDVRFINPFIESIMQMFDTMLGASAQRASVSLVRPGQHKHHMVCGIIGLSGHVQGVVALVMPIETSKKITVNLLGDDTAAEDMTQIADTVAELVNIVAGSTKPHFARDEVPVELSLPTVVQGNGFELEYPSDAKWIEVSFKSEFGPFSMRVTLKESHAESGVAS